MENPITLSAPIDSPVRIDEVKQVIAEVPVLKDSVAELEEGKLDKVITEGDRRVYVINPDGTQDTDVFEKNAGRSRVVRLRPEGLNNGISVIIREQGEAQALGQPTATGFRAWNANSGTMVEGTLQIGPGVSQPVFISYASPGIDRDRYIVSGVVGGGYNFQMPGLGGTNSTLFFEWFNPDIELVVSLTSGGGGTHGLVNWDRANPVSVTTVENTGTSGLSSSTARIEIFNALLRSNRISVGRILVTGFQRTTNRSLSFELDIASFNRQDQDRIAIRNFVSDFPSFQLEDLNGGLRFAGTSNDFNTIVIERKDLGPLFAGTAQGNFALSFYALSENMSVSRITFNSPPPGSPILIPWKVIDSPSGTVNPSDLISEDEGNALKPGSDFKLFVNLLKNVVNIYDVSDIDGAVIGGTSEEFNLSIKDKVSAGTMVTGTVYFSDLPQGVGQAEIVMIISMGNWLQHKSFLFSQDVAPGLWHATGYMTDEIKWRTSGGFSDIASTDRFLVNHYDGVEYPVRIGGLSFQAEDSFGQSRFFISPVQFPGLISIDAIRGVIGHYATTIGSKLVFYYQDNNTHDVLKTITENAQGTFDFEEVVNADVLENVNRCMLSGNEVWLCRFNANNEHTGLAEAFLFNVNAPSEIWYKRETEVAGLKMMFDAYNEANGSITITDKNGIFKTLLTDIRSEKFEVYTDVQTGAQITVTYNIDIQPLLPLLPRLAEIILMMINVTESGKITLPDGEPENLRALAKAFVLGGVSRIKAKIDFVDVIGADFSFQVGSSIYAAEDIETNEIAGTFIRPLLGDETIPSSQYMANFTTDGTDVFLNVAYLNDTVPTLPDNSVTEYRAGTVQGFPATGIYGVRYLETDTGDFYRWNGSAYVLEFGGGGDSLEWGDF
jgi:hypothetical protein